jgi:flavin-binding protein dodecin
MHLTSLADFANNVVRQIEREDKVMAKKNKSEGSIYKVVEVIGTSPKSWAEAGRNAVEKAAGTLRDLRIAEVVKLDMAVEDGEVRAFRARVALSFKYEG